MVLVRHVVKFIDYDKDIDIELIWFDARDGIPTHDIILEMFTICFSAHIALTESLTACGAVLGFRLPGAVSSETVSSQRKSMLPVLLVVTKMKLL
eukprot:436356-Ditylum_brightwellii.AAC.1